MSADTITVTPALLEAALLKWRRDFEALPPEVQASHRASQDLGTLAEKAHADAAYLWALLGGSVA